MNIKNKFTEMSVLSPLLSVYTIAYLGLMIYDFAARQAFEMPAGMMAIYIALLGAYVADKEIRRWLGKEQESKRGSVFVYLWLLFFLAAFIIYSFKREFVLPGDLSLVALQVLGIFFGTKASKKFYEMKSSSKPEVILGREETALEMIGKNGKVTRKDVMAGLKLSRSSAGRLLAGMEEKGLIKQVGGEAKDAYYVLSEGK